MEISISHAFVLRNKIHLVEMLHRHSSQVYYKHIDQYC